MYQGCIYRDFELKVHETFLDFLKENLTDLDELLLFIEESNYSKSFRWIVELGNIQFLCLVKPLEKEIVFYSKWLFRELNLKRLDLEDKHVEELYETPLNNTPSHVYYNSIINKLPLFSGDDYKDLASKTEEIAAELKLKIEEYKIPLFEHISNFGLDLTANYALIRIHLLKYLAVLPSLNHDEGEEVKRLFLESLRRLLEDSKDARLKGKTGDERPLPIIYTLVISILLYLCRACPAKLLAFIIRYKVELLATRFIAGVNIESAKKALSSLEKTNRCYTIDQLGELVVSGQEANQYKDKVLDIIKGIESKEPRLNEAQINYEHISIKVSALSNDFRPYAFESVFNEVAPRLREILVTAKKCNVFINIDAEHYHFRDIIFKIYRKILIETPELQDYKYTGIVVQAYLKDSYEHLLDVLKLSQERDIAMPIRLVKGAYWDAETVECDAHNLESFQFLNKEETDLNFRQLADFILKNSENLILSIASHNILDHSFCRALKDLYYPNALIEHQCLHMTYEGLSNGLSKMGYSTRNYIPVGDLLVGMAYLVRRIMENSSQVGVLTIMRSHKEELRYNDLYKEIQNKKYVYSRALSKFRNSFRNVYPIRVYLEKKFAIVDEKLKSEFVLEPIETDTIEELEGKILKLQSPHAEWSKVLIRSQKLFKFADLLLIHREELTQVIMNEAHKTLEEAIADVDEAIDFVNFYVRTAINISNLKEYEPKGIIGVIAPWNFPLAISVGMSIAPLAMGNTVLLKPSEKTSQIAAEFLRLMRIAGIDESIFNITYGAGDIGEAMSSYSEIEGIVFTGSMHVGSQIYKKLKIRPRDNHLPLAITEMGGKNAVIVTNNCELDETVFNLLYSSFAHAGQKCSASSRIIIDNKVKKAFLERFVDAAKDINVGPALDLSTYVNPLIGEMEKQKTLENVKQCQAEIDIAGGVVHLDKSSDYPGSLVGPTIFELSKEQALSEFSQAKKEFFAPIIHLIGYDTLEEAIEIFNSTPYALTGGIFSQSNDDCEYLMDRMQAGNIYINRSNTGARVAIEPFGGFKLSGTGPKAGSKDYLYPFANFKDEKVDDTTLYNEYRRFTSKLELESDIFLNRQIPGQVNYNKNNLPLGRGLVLLDSPLTFMQKIEIALAVKFGNEIAIHFTKKHIYEGDDYESLCKLAGKKLIRLNALDPVHYTHFNFMLGNMNTVQVHISDFIQESSKELKKVYTFSHKTTEFKQLMLKYTHSRSYAINIMRHGALMDIQENV